MVFNNFENSDLILQVMYLFLYYLFYLFLFWAALGALAGALRPHMPQGMAKKQK